MNKPDFEKAAKEYARNHSSAPDKETPDWIINDFLSGCEHAYSIDKWISVKDKLPEDQQRVLAYGLGGRTVTAIFKEMGGASYSTKDQSGNFLAYNYFSEDLDFAEEMTHWMPLPKPPSTP